MFEKILTKIANYKGDFEGLSAIIKDTCEELKIAKLESFFYEQNAKEQPACVLYAKDGAKSHFAFAKKYEGEKTLVFHIHAFDCYAKRANSSFYNGFIYFLPKI